MDIRERIEAFLQTAESPNRDVTELKAIYNKITGKRSGCTSETCVSKMLKEVRKYYHLTYVAPVAEAVKGRKHILKPGNHAFAPGGPAVHNNDNTTDAEIDWYLETYPHVKNLLT